MTAAIYAKRANLRVALLESNVTGGLVNSTYTVENFPSYPEIHGMELMEKMRRHVDYMGVEVEEVFEIEGLELSANEKIVHGYDMTYKAPAIILCTGRKPIALDVPTECDQIHFCAICDGAPYKGKRVLVVGGGNSAFDEGLYLLNLGVEELTIVEVMDRYFAAQTTQDTLFSDAVILERILCVKKLLVHVSRITGCRTCDLSVPLLHRPSVCVVRVERNDGRIVSLDRLQCRDELIRCLRCLCHSGLCEDSLVVYNTLCITGRRNTVYQSVVIPGICELDLSFHLIECAVRQEILAQVCLVNCRDHHDVAPVTAL